MSAVESVEMPAKADRELPPSMVERMTLILDAFTGPTTRLTLEQIARATHLPRSTAHRILDQLVKLAWLDHTSFGYALGSRSLTLGATGDRGINDLRTEAAPMLHDLMVRTGLVVHLAVLDQGQVHYLDKMGGRFAGAVPSRVGGRAPAHSTALGKAMLAWLEPETVDEIVGEELDRTTRNTIGNLNTLHQELHRIRSRGGLAYERGECFTNIACVAAAVRDADGPIGAISLVGDSQAPLERVAGLVAAATRELSQALSPQLAKPVRPRRRTDGLVPEQTWSPETMGRLMAAGRSSWM
ncbi:MULTISPECIES: IclR family transcriptional regulator [unclassified Nocardioides]|uniref:IclR family transcriptional regulator n=1 Tax=unclassified Nocardioides TaxID=2615069 RepID=UPI0006FE2C0D|nr:MULTISPECIES: IclR family transcriptional regulator [unclassified Nocardioides]KQY50942.1 IclR family transcriptional regulator [Nocardioides sp. Root140]KQZ75569.1 IclR family transcriptional regulator [Nocardioides sp. Root151]KRF14637.1 IclR family transcriptional regulator [Nocardioides sp. Soil796]